MERQRVLNLGFVMEHEKLRWNTNSFWGPETAPFVYTSSHWGVESSREGTPDSNIGSSYQPPPTTASSASVRRVHKGKKKRAPSPISCSSSRASLRWSHWRGTASFQEAGSSEGDPSFGGELVSRSTGVVNRSSTPIPEEIEESNSIGVCHRQRADEGSRSRLERVGC